MFLKNKITPCRGHIKKRELHFPIFLQPTTFLSLRSKDKMAFNNKSIDPLLIMLYLTIGPDNVAHTTASSLSLLRYHAKVGIKYTKKELEVPSTLSSEVIKIDASLTGTLNEVSNFFDEYSNE